MAMWEDIPGKGPARGNSLSWELGCILEEQ